MSTDVLWIIAVIIAIAGIVLLVVACAVGPGGWSVFHDRGKHNNGLPAHAVTQLH